MNNQTTPVNLTQEVKKLWNSFDRLILFAMQNKKVAQISLMPQQHHMYCAQIKDKHYQGNPFYRGIEIKKMGEA